MKKICTRFFIILILAFLSVNSLGAVMPTKPVDTSTEVYLGGRPLGIEIGADGLIVTGISKVETANGAEFPMKDSGVRSGDVLTKIAGKSVVKPEDISTIVNKLPSTDVILTFLRDGKPFEVRAKFVVDKNGERRFGVNVRDKITGIGTLTYVTTDGKFGALGHHIADSETGIISALTSGSIFDAYIDGVKKSMPDKAGELIGSFSRSDPVGRIKKKKEFGIFGERLQLGGQQFTGAGRRSAAFDLEQQTREILAADAVHRGRHRPQHAAAEPDAQARRQLRDAAAQQRGQRGRFAAGGAQCGVISHGVFSFDIFSGWKRS